MRVVTRIFHLFSVKDTLQLRHFREVTPGEHAEGVVDLSPGWSEAEPWVLNISMRPALKERYPVKFYRLSDCVELETTLSL